MRDKSPPTPAGPEADFSRKVGADETRKVNAKRHGVQDIWMGLGMFGLIGWAVAIPTVLGALLGAFIDKHHPGVHSWTLSLLIVGLFLGCLNAWHWVSKEEKAIRKDEEEEEDE
jgi:ATP synthase protein I